MVEGCSGVYNTGAFYCMRQDMLVVVWYLKKKKWSLNPIISYIK